MIDTTFTVPNKAGLHARAAAKLVEVTSRFDSIIEIGNEEQMVDGKSILSIMLLAAPQGSPLKLKINGDDAEQALDAIQELVDKCFDEE